MGFRFGCLVVAGVFEFVFSVFGRWACRYSYFVCWGSGLEMLLRWVFVRVFSISIVFGVVLKVGFSGRLFEGFKVFVVIFEVWDF